MNILKKFREWEPEYSWEASEWEDDALDKLSWKS